MLQKVCKGIKPDRRSGWIKSFSNPLLYSDRYDRGIHNSRLWMHLSHTGEKRRISDKGFLEVV